MDLPANPFKRALAEGRPQIGLWCTLSHHVVVEVVAGSGFDWLCLDTEHSPNELPMVLSQLQAAAAYPTHAVVRPAWNDMVLIKRLLDIGAQTLLLPYVQNAEEARRAVSYTRYPPEGRRGLAGVTRASRYGRVGGYARRAHEELCVLVQVETRIALGEIEAIAAVEGVDGIFVGPADLAADMGHAGESGHPEVQAAVEQAITRIRAAGKPAGILISDENLARRYLQLGALFVAVGVDTSILARETQALAARFNTITAAPPPPGR
jgi:4-hydroxy-2-oxoheptanedioate aldolase